MIVFNPILNNSYQVGIITSKPKVKTANFGGCTRLVINTPKHPRPFLSTEEFLQVTSPFKSKVVGKLPKNFLELFPGETKKVFQFFDEFSNFARGIEFNKGESVNLQLSSNKKLKMTFIGEGDFGKAFKMKVCSKKYVLKIFTLEHHQNQYSSINGAAAEARTGLNLCSKDYSDIVKFHISNFDDDKMWQISEYIDKKKDFSESRKGKKVLEDRPDLYLDDDKEENKTNGILIDLGGIAPLDIGLLEVTKRKQAFYDALKNPSSKYRKGIASQVEWLKASERKQAFYDILNHSDAKIKTGLASQIEWLKASERKQAFEDVLEHPSPEIKKGIAAQIEYLYNEDRSQAFYTLLYHNDSTIKKGIATQIGSLNRIDRKMAFYDVLYHQDATAQKGIATQIQHLDTYDRNQAFYDVLNHPDSTIKKGIATQIEYLNEYEDANDKKEAFYAVLNHPDPIAKQDILPQAECLTDWKEAQQAVLNMINKTNQTFKIIVKN